MRDGDFSVRLLVAWVGLEGKIADTLNDMRVRRDTSKIPLLHFPENGVNQDLAPVLRLKNSGNGHQLLSSNKLLRRSII
jgi:hypothetical protein